jgi:hypothetical protein
MGSYGGAIDPDGVDLDRCYADLERVLERGLAVA